MKSNWIEIKRFLNDYKRFVLIGSIIVAILFGLIISSIDMFKEESIEEQEEDSELSSEEILNDAQPAYFKLYIEDEDGKEFKNSFIINEYFNLDSVKQKIEEDTGIDIESIEKEVIANELDDGDEIKIINVRRNDNSFLITASFNLGSERENLVVAEHYFELLNSDDFLILEDKTINIFEEPNLAKKPEEDLNIEELDEEKNDLEPDSFSSSIMSHTKKLVIGFIMGIVFLTGLALLKVIFGKTLDYSFTYVEEGDTFILADEKLENKDLITQVVAYPFKNKKTILSEEKIDLYTRNILAANNKITFDENIEDKKIITSIQSLSELEIETIIPEIIIIIHPKLTTRKWYEKQREFANINKIIMKIIQVNY